MTGLEIRIPGVVFQGSGGFPYRTNVPAEDMTVQKNLQYYSDSVRMKSSFNPLFTLDDEVDWSIVDGSTYCSIDACTGDLSIDSSAITQMVKVRATSRSNRSLYYDKEIVITHRDTSAPGEAFIDIYIDGVQQSYTYDRDSSNHSFWVGVRPDVDINMGYEFLEGDDCIDILGVSNVSTGQHSGEVKVDFNQRGNHTGKQVVMRFYDTDHPDDVYEDASFTVYAGINRIDTSYLHTYSSQDQTAYYFWGNEYSFSYFADPVVNRNLEVIATQNGDRIEMWNDVSDGISQGTIGFRPVSTSENSVIKLRIYDPDSSTATYKNCQFKVSTPRISDISVYGNRKRYSTEASTGYERIGFYADPSIHRPLIMDISTGQDLVDWYMSDRTEDAGVFNFKLKEAGTEGIV